jgi:hypothetical protein
MTDAQTDAQTDAEQTRARLQERIRWAKAQDRLITDHNVKVDARGPGADALEAILAVLDEAKAKTRASEPQELAIDAGNGMFEADLMAEVRDAVDLASDHNGITWVMGGPDHKRLAAIVPVDVAERDIADYR